MKTLFETLPWKRSGIKTRLLHPYDELWDRRLGVRTFGYRPAIGFNNDPFWRAHYVPTRYGILQRVLAHLEPKPDDVFVDLGSGLGRAVFLASWLGVKRAVGIEANVGLVCQAQRMLRRSRLAERNIEFLYASAESYLQHETSILFMFHPFGAGTLQSVVDQILAGLERRERPLRIAYLNSVHAAVLDSCPAFRRLDHWPRSSVPWLRAGRYPATFWTTR